MNTRFEAAAHPRIALLGNPSDAYEGRVLAMAFRDFSAKAVVRVGVASSEGPSASFVKASSDVERLLRDDRTSGGAKLQLAALRQYVMAQPGSEEFVSRGIEMSFASDIPRQSGLAGSSAIVIATLRALGSAAGSPLGRFEMAEAALRAETEDLGIAAGPQDRVIQSYEGLLFMDFAAPRSEAGFESIDPGLLPPLFVVWGSEPGEDSGRVHVDVRGRYERGDHEVVRSMNAFAGIADAGREALLAKDVEGFGRAVDQNFDLRAQLFSLGPTDRVAIDLGRREGAWMKFPGSGGAVVGVARDVAHREAVSRVFASHGWNVVHPVLAHSGREETGDSGDGAVDQERSS